MSQDPVSSRDKPRFSAGLVTLIITLFWIAVFAYFVFVGAKGFPQ